MLAMAPLDNDILPNLQENIRQYITTTPQNNLLSNVAAARVFFESLNDHDKISTSFTVFFGQSTKFYYHAPT